VEKIEFDCWGSLVKVCVRWYYQLEESIGGFPQFHDAKELFLSDHFNEQSINTIEGKCSVHTFKNYTKLDSVGFEYYFFHFKYNTATRGFIPDRVVVEVSEICYEIFSLFFTSRGFDLLTSETCL
jgi:hypothetical protein